LLIFCIDTGLCIFGVDLWQACNKAQTTWNPEITDESQLDEFACHDVGPMHTTDAKGSENPTNVKGAFHDRIQMKSIPS
jgi:hypothetical protein